MESLIQQAEKFRLHSLTAAELSDLGLLYRQAAADLSAVRSDRSAKISADYLNRLVARAHHLVYAGKKSTLRSALHFFTREYPAIFRAMIRFTSASLLIFLAGMLLGTLLTLARPDFMRQFLGPTMVRTIERHQMWTDSVVAMKPQASAQITTNNLSVTFMTFAGGIVGGIGTVLLLFNNGLLMGVVSTACAQHHMSLSLWSFVASHGALELPAIFIAGGAGLRVGWGLLFPGLLSRRESLVAAGSDAVRLLAGTIPMLIVAGALEGFLSPTKTPVGIKFGVCATLLSLLWVWLGWRRNPITEDHLEALEQQTTA